MFRSSDMRKANIFAASKDKEKVLDILHESGLIQIIDLKGQDIGLTLSNPGDELKEISDKLLRVSRLATIMKLSPMNLTFTQQLFGLELLEKKKIKRKSKAALLKHSIDFLKHNEETLLNIEEENLSLTEKLNLLNDQRKVVELLTNLNIPLDEIEISNKVLFTVGRITSTHIEKFKTECTQELNELCHIDVREEKNKDSIITIISLKKDESKVNLLTKKHSINTFALPDLEEQSVKFIDKEINNIEKRKKEIIKEVEDIQNKIFTETIALREELELLKEKYEAIHRMMNSEKFFLVTGWVSENNVKKLEHKISNIGIIKLEEPKDEDIIPVETTNPGWLKPFEVLTELYSLPKYKDLDPTFIVGPIFVIFAGFMLTDFVYGLGLVILGSFLIKKFGQYSQGLKDISLSILLIGIFSMIFGVLTGSYLGDMMKYINPEWTSGNLAFWGDPLSDPLYFLIISLGVALVHVNFGLIMGLTEDVRKKDYKTLIGDRVVWFILQIGIALWATGFLATLGKTLFGLGVLIKIVTAGPLGLLDITGFMGDVISYSRLFALALSTAGIAMTVNLLADLLSGVPFVGVILAALIFITGHLFSFAMNALGGFVHSIRLQFVEFFGKFYEGGGDRFEPFKENRIYTEAKK